MKTPFGTMLNNYRYEKRRMIDKVVLAMKKKHGADQYKYNNEGDEFEVRESSVHAKDGSTVIKVELWKRLEVERVKISTSVVAEKVEDEIKVEEKSDDWLK